MIYAIVESVLVESYFKRALHFFVYRVLKMLFDNAQRLELNSHQAQPNQREEITSPRA
jgi:hypothetical protein